VAQKVARGLQADSSDRSWGPALVLVVEAGKPRVEHWPAEQDRFDHLVGLWVCSQEALLDGLDHWYALVEVLALPDAHEGRDDWWVDAPPCAALHHVGRRHAYRQLGGAMADVLHGPDEYRDLIVQALV
jgi:hypothetical protein